MKVFRSLSDYQQGHKTVLTIGTFDGVHLGHQHILDQVKSRAKKLGGESLLMTFHPHPRKVLSADGAPDLRLLQTLDEKIATLKSYGLDKLLVMPFTREFSQLSAEDYVKQILAEGIGVAEIIIGFDHKFGASRQGDFALLKSMGKEHGFKVREISAQLLDEVKVSSSRIREALETGEIETAETLLGRPYGLSGEVVHGDHLGRQLGFPTANLGEVNPHKLIPKIGVYAVLVGSEGLDQHPAMMNIGYRPTVDGRTLRLEVHLLNFDNDLYGQELEVQFVKRLRDEKRFAGVDALQAQLTRDKAAAEAVFNR